MKHPHAKGVILVLAPRSQGGTQAQLHHQIQFNCNLLVGQRYTSLRIQPGRIDLEIKLDRKLDSLVLPCAKKKTSEQNKSFCTP